MTWDHLDLGKPKQSSAEAETAKQQHEMLMRETTVALDQNPALRDYLMKLAVGASYLPGRSADAVAHAEGVRSLAVQLLRNGGILK